MTILEPGSPGTEPSVTALLTELSAGNRAVEALLVPQIYTELRRLAGHYMRFERKNHTLQPTALVNEAYARLVQQPQVSWQNRAHFFATASHLMRHILVDYLLILDEAIEHLAQFDPRQARIVELHFFGGLTFEETAEVLKTSERTVQRDWNMARAWLKGELSKQP
jgi:RNA polymerase sigma-70 factor (ECF subfamily)